MPCRAEAGVAEVDDVGGVAECFVDGGEQIVPEIDACRTRLWSIERTDRVHTELARRARPQPIGRVDAHVDAACDETCGERTRHRFHPAELRREVVGDDGHLAHGATRVARGAQHGVGRGAVAGHERHGPMRGAHGGERTRGQKERLDLIGDGARLVRTPR